MIKLPYLPMFVDDFFGGTMRWDGEKQALYALLLMHQWASGPLPRTPAEIAEAIHYDLQRFKKLWDTVQKKFSLTEDGWVNHVLEEHRAKALQLASLRAELGSKGGKAAAQAKAAAKAQAIAQAQLSAEPIAGLQAGLEPSCQLKGQQNSSIQSNPILRGLSGGKV
jgi:uncharacterized protein YdaU (DUF1376 family)